MPTRRTIPRAIALATVATLLTACGDATAPQNASVAPSTARAVRPSFDISGQDVPLTIVGDTTYATFTVRPNEAETYVFDRHSAISFPTNAICETSDGYGPTLWDEACTPTSEDVTFSVKSYALPNGHVMSEFSPAVRFNPATSGVHLYLEDYPGATRLWSADILYCNDFGWCIDESLTDPSLETYFDPETGLYGRRIKHFSGYSVGVGRDGESY